MQSVFKNTLLIVGFLLCGGCSSLKAKVEDGASLAAGRSYFVIHQEKDGRAINELIATKLKETGRPATTGSLAEMPAGTQVMVTYVDRWAWDITNYLRSLEVVFRDPQTESVLASGISKRDSVTRKGVATVVDEVVNEVFKQVGATEASAPAP